MVIRVGVHTVSILIGVLVCIYAVVFYPLQTVRETAEFESPLHVLIIDPGHGGADGGAVGIDGTIESKLNLEIALKLNTLCKLYGVNTVLTRNSEQLEYPPEADSIAKMKVADQKARLRLIRDYPHGILFSIHQNAYPSAAPKGVQVLYGHKQGSREVGELLQTNLVEALCPESRRVAAEISSDIYLMKHCDCTAALIECGFISNPEECTRLQSQEYQKKISAVLLGSYLQYVHGIQK